MSSASSTSGCAEKGQLGFVAIPLRITRHCHRGSNVNALHMFWPALLFPSSEALRRCLPSQSDVHMFNTEWGDHQMKGIGAWAEGFGPRFGLFAVDYTNFARAPRDSAGVYAEIIRHGISEELWDAHRGPF